MPDPHIAARAQEKAEAIVRCLDGYLTCRELSGKDPEGWFTERDVDLAQSELTQAIEEAIRVG